MKPRSKPADDGVVIRLNVECLDEAARYLIQLGCPFLVRQPEELRAVLRGLAAEIAQAAEPRDRRRRSDLSSRRVRRWTTAGSAAAAT